MFNKYSASSMFIVYIVWNMPSTPPTILFLGNGVITGYLLAYPLSSGSTQLAGKSRVTLGQLVEVLTEKVNFRSQILVCPSIGEYWNTFGVPVLPENVIFTFFRMCWCYSEAYNTGTQKWFSIVQYSCTSIWDFKFTFSFTLIWVLKV